MREFKCKRSLKLKYQIEEKTMVGKPTYEELEQRVKSLEKEIAERDQVREERTVSKQSLKDSQHLLQTLIDTIEGEVFVKDTNGKYLFVNKAFGEDFGVDPKAVIGKDDFFVFSPEVAANLQENDKRIMDTKKAENIEESGVHKGRYGIYLTNKAPLIDNDGNILGICGVGFNITRQKKMGEALRVSEEKYKILVENSYDIVYSVTPDGTINFIGPQISRFGHTPEDVISKHYLEFVVPEQRQEVMHSFEKGTGNGTSFPTEFQLLGKDGKHHWVEAVGKILYDDSENPLLQIGILRDIAERKLAEEALQESEAKYQDLYDSAPDMFVSVDAKTANIRDCNQTLANALGYTKEEIIGRPVFDMYTPDSSEHAKSNVFPAFLKNGTITGEELQLQRKDGSKIDVSLHASALRDEQGNILFSRSVWRDITRSKEMEAVLKKAHDDLEIKVEERTARLSETLNKLRQTEFRYRTVADFTYDWEYWINLDGTLEYVSPSCERISGYAPGQFLDNPSLLQEIVIPEDQVILSKHHHDSRKEPKAREIRFRIRGRDGTVRWIEHVCQPVLGDQGEMLGFRASNRDITKRKEGEINLQKAYLEIEQLKDQLELDRSYLREEIKLEHNYDNIIGNSDVMQYVLFRAEQIAPTDTTVLILGETGTGKELIARAIHSASLRKERPLIKIDCASLPASLIESELFGHEKGAFTGAAKKRIGRFELAHGSTLFLDEIGELPLDLQPKLLRILQDGEYERLGSSQTLRTDVRVIAATNRNLEEDVKRKKFRMDLWYRLNIFVISIPALRKRGEDIALLVNYMIKKFERKHGKQITTVPTKVLTKLQNYFWPGNVREMENVIERAVINTQGDMLHLYDALEAFFPADLESSGRPIKSLAELEREHILRVLKNTNWKIHGKNNAADLLDINPSTLRGRMRKHGIQRPPYKT
jgi:PAS domain S-box-containing protein